MKTNKILKQEKNNLKKEYAKRYLLKYIKELKVHFDLSEDETKEIIRSVWYSKSNLHHIITKIGKLFKEKP